MTLIDGLISCTGLVPNDPWVVAHVVGILYWVGAQRPLGCSPSGWDIMGCSPSSLVVVALVDMSCGCSP
jgi:hypothetical protein